MSIFIRIIGGGFCSRGWWVRRWRWIYLGDNSVGDIFDGFLLREG